MPGTPINFGSVSLSNASVVFIEKDAATNFNTGVLTIGGQAVALTLYATSIFFNSSNWGIRYATGITKSGAMLLYPNGSFGPGYLTMMDLRVIKGTIQASDLDYLIRDILNNQGNNVMPSMGS